MYAGRGSTGGANRAATNGSQSKGSNEDARKIFVGGLSWESTSDDLRSHFSKYGPIVEATIKTDTTTGRSRGFGFVLFADESSVDLSINDKDHVLNGKKIDPKRAVPGGVLEGVKKIFVGGLDPSLTEEDIIQHFSQYGKVEQVQLPYDRTKNIRRAFGFVTFDSVDTVDRICQNPKIPYGDKMVDVRKVVAKDMRNGRGGGRGGMMGGPDGPPMTPGMSPYGGPPGGAYGGYNGTYQPTGYPTGYEYYAGYGAMPAGAAAPGPAAYQTPGYGVPQAWPGYDQTGQPAQPVYGQPAPGYGAPTAGAPAPGGAAGYDGYTGGWQGDSSGYGKVKGRGGGAPQAYGTGPSYHPYSR